MALLKSRGKFEIRRLNCERGGSNFMALQIKIICRFNLAPHPLCWGRQPDIHGRSPSGLSLNKRSHTVPCVYTSISLTTINIYEVKARSNVTWSTTLCTLNKRNNSYLFMFAIILSLKTLFKSTLLCTQICISRTSCAKSSKFLLH